MRNDHSKTKEASGASLPDDPMAAANGVDITEQVLSVTYVKLPESLGAFEIARIAFAALMETANSEREHGTSVLVLIDEFQEVAKTENGQPQ